MKLQIAATGSNDPEVHAAGCTDIQRGLRTRKYQDVRLTGDYDTAYAVVLDWWQDIIAERVEDAQYLHDHPEARLTGDTGELTTEAAEVRDLAPYVKFLPCTKGLPGGFRPSKSTSSR